MTVESKAMDHIKKVLKEFGDKYFTKDGALKRNTVIEDLDNYDKDLMTAILSDDLLHETYTTRIADVEIFEINKFVDMLRYKEYWEDSFTKYNNKIGLTVDGRYIDDSSDVVLDFPYKDCVLKAGMTKEDVEHSRNANEPFLNETLAKPEIDELLEPKIFVNAKKYYKSGNKSITEITEKDNLIIKGNNLIALYSLKKRYAGKVKLIYIDPPYNTGSDSFAYNDRFNHTAWLTFMKNRLEVAKDLLTDDGLLFVHLDYNEDSYAKILLDMIFGRNSYVTTISVKSNSLSGNKTQYKDKTILKNKDSILVFVKDKAELSITPQFEAKRKWDTHYNQILIGDDVSGYKVANLKDVLERENIIDGDNIRSSSWNDNKFREYIIKNNKRIFRWVNSIPTELKNNSLAHPNEIVYHNNTSGNRMYAMNGKRLSMLSKSFHVINGRNVPAQLLGDLWTDIDFQNTQNQGGFSFKNAKKPEQLLKRIISMGTTEGDIVLDFFMGSATTQAVAMKMHRRFIGIEQMDYINTVSVPRLQRVIEGEQGGISKDVNWQGGDSFIYAEFMEKNQSYLKDIQNAKNIDDLMSVYARMKQNGDIDFRVDLDKFESSLKAGELPSFSDRKKALIKIIDKNQLYYNYSNIDDANVKDLISDSDYEFNKSFYSSDKVGEE